MNYSQTLEYLYAQLPMFTRIGAAAFKKDLTNTLALCEVLRNPQNTFKSVHIAGTNGKGSTSHMLTSILQQAGYKAGLYTSPHLKDFRERVRVNGDMIPETYVVNFVEQHQDVFDNIRPSFFEWTVALAFDYFAAQKVDIAIIETGLGGRLDSTNIITPLLSVITNIGWDHMDMLGDTLEKIAGEKAGIIKPATPVIIGEYQPDIHPVFEQKAREENSPLTLAGDLISLESFAHDHYRSRFNILREGKPWMQDVLCDLPGIYQQYNIATVLAAVAKLSGLGLNIPDEAIRNGLLHVKEQTGLGGRWQVLGEHPLIVCDTGHNVNGITYVIDQLQQSSFKKLHMVIGMVKDKDISKVLSLLPKEATYYFCQADIPRALPAGELQQQAKAAELIGQGYPSVRTALEAAKQQADPDDLIFVGGSTFVVAEVV